MESNELLRYFSLGFTHVIPFGFDHILFIVSLYLLEPKLKSIIMQCSVFTIAHSISLAMTASGIFMVNNNYVEPLIALSILFTSLGNLFQHKINNWRLIIVFVFGVIHGLGFAGALKDAGLPSENFYSSLISFNVGIEIAQLSIIIVLYFVLGRLFNSKKWYFNRIVYPLSGMIASIALFWTIQRLGIF